MVLNLIKLGGTMKTVSAYNNSQTMPKNWSGKLAHVKAVPMTDLTLYLYGQSTFSVSRDVPGTPNLLKKKLPG